MNRRDFLKAVPAMTAVSVCVPSLVKEDTAYAVGKQRLVYRLMFAPDGRVTGEEKISFEELMPGDVFHMNESDGTPVDAGECCVCGSEPAVNEGGGFWVKTTKWGNTSYVDSQESV